MHNKFDVQKSQNNLQFGMKYLSLEAPIQICIDDGDEGKNITPK